MSTTTPTVTRPNLEIQFPAANPVVLIDIGGIIDGAANKAKRAVAKAMDPDLHRKVRNGAGALVVAGGTAFAAAKVSGGTDALLGLLIKKAPTKLFGYFDA